MNTPSLTEEQEVDWCQLVSRLVQEHWGIHVSPARCFDLQEQGVGQDAASLLLCAKAVAEHELEGR